MKTPLTELIDKLLGVMATQSNKDVIHGINISIGHIENTIEKEKKAIVEAHYDSEVSVAKYFMDGLNQSELDEIKESSQRYYDKKYAK